ncbi:MAG: ABC transporter ATP-binding protein/permease [Clostridia bacterium]|nr:ABC transporter ATP-binding protein/permease [Clostridia bacterium]
MLELVDIKKDYPVAGGVVSALKGVSIKFRKNELVSILGASGCGKTTLLNIIGGLDKYTSGDLIIEGKSTKQYRDGDWDTYRNHSIGFIFQSYHLIPHQTVLQNVELALLISGVSKEERRQRAIAALERVGLGDKLKNRPNQLSGGQAQRVAIARALINDPEIVLADEPTGALDSKTSVQIMELLKEIAKDRLVIMVTHNPELAEQYSTRIIRLLDGEVIDDSKPYDGAEEVAPATEAQQSEAPAEQQPKTNKGKKKKASMSVGMAMSLSLKNLLSKIKRTSLVSIAGSIGIIGVSMVLAISAGVKGYIAKMQDDMLSGNPLEITRTAINFNSLMSMGTSNKVKVEKLGDKVYVDSLIETLMGMGSLGVTNNITDAYTDYVSKMPETYYNAVYYDYGFEPANNIYTTYKLDKNDKGEEISVTGIRQTYSAVLGEVANNSSTDVEKQQYKMFAGMIPSVTTFKELPDNYDYVLSQYDIVATYNDKTVRLTEEELKDIFCAKDSLIMVINKKATTDLTMGQMGYFTQEEFLAYAERAKELVGEEITEEQAKEKYGELLSQYLDGKEYDYFLDKDDNNTKFKWYPNNTVYTKLDPVNNPMDAMYSQTIPYETTDENGKTITAYKPAEFKYNPYAADSWKDNDDNVNLKVKVILQKKSGVTYGCLETGLYYTNALATHALETGRNSEIVKTINDSDHKGSLEGLPYFYHYTYDNKTLPSMYYVMDGGGGLSMSSMMSSMMGGGSSSSSQYDAFKVKPSTVAGGTTPIGFAFYPLDFDSKDLVTGYLDKWNDMCDKGETYGWTVTTAEKWSTDYAGVDVYSTWSVDNDDNGNPKQNEDGTYTYTITLNLEEKYKITYTDAVGLMITMINTMVEMITIALIAFTALSLVVSTVMIGIITYVSVVERIKEIGILRAVGARKKDIKRLFNAETFIIGLCAGVVGIIITYLLSLIINLIVMTLAGIAIAALPIWQAIIMICVSVVLTLISGLIPASAAAKKDPVVALRTE